MACGVRISPPFNHSDVTVGWCRTQLEKLGVDLSVVPMDELEAGEGSTITSILEWERRQVSQSVATTTACRIIGIRSLHHSLR